MTYLLAQIFLCLLAAALIGALTAWFLRQRVARRREAIMHEDWRKRVQQVEADRERIVRRLTDRIAAMEAATPAADDGAGNAARVEYEDLVARLEERVAERESVIGEQRKEISALRTELAEAAEAARQQANEAAEGDAARGSRDQAREARVAELETALQDREERLGKAMAELGTARAAADERAVEVQGGRGESSSDARIADLEAAIRQRDDSIAVLRDDLAQFADQEVIESRGRQDEQLRTAMDEALAWERRYTEAAAKLADSERRIAALEKRLAEPEEGTRRRSRRAGRALAGQSRRSAGERIGAVLAGAPTSRDNLRKIRGIGPALERMLNELGIFHYSQLAELDPEGVARIAREIGRFGDRIVRDDWVGQARRLAARED